MKIGHLPCQPSPLSANPCHNNQEKETGKKRGREKSERVWPSCGQCRTTSLRFTYGYLDKDALIQVSRDTGYALFANFGSLSCPRPPSHLYEGDERRAQRMCELEPILDPPLMSTVVRSVITWGTRNESSRWQYNFQLLALILIRAAILCASTQHS
ncbi:unnamed protein product [Pleuronectes platessa]|uniref:Uncharacterized protein n=1 Tax=Pleuronectes platessa TaxID=8262 RepID=A0A9N7UIK2_PLEPL|nr:unnamed protein product [Pleuronectes platessa]